MEAYGGLFSFRLEDGFVLPNISHLLFLDSLYEACSLNWLSRELVVLDFLSEMFLISVIDIIDPYDFLIGY